MKKALNLFEIWCRAPPSEPIWVAQQKRKVMLLCSPFCSIEQQKTQAQIQIISLVVAPTGQKVVLCTKFRINYAEQPCLNFCKARIVVVHQQEELLTRRSIVK
jgi:hypothetical protein